MRIVLVGADAAARLVPLNAVVQALHAAERPDIFRIQTDAAAVAALFADLLARPGHFALIAEGEAGDLGYAYCEILDTPDDALMNARRRGVLHHIATVPAARRQGVATALIDAAKARFRAAGAREWTTSYHAWNAASAVLMAKAGLRVTIIRAEGRL
jgi:ribosomal protein S18 acetylase RimI-like enzyme